MLINTSLLRERFVIENSDLREDPLVALGNRILLPLTSYNGEIKERLIIRAHSMHMALRLAARITHEFYKNGPIINRQKPMSWKDMWYDLTSDFEYNYNPETWCCVYHNGRIVFQDGEHHPFLDVIEQCDIKNRDEYDRAINIAEEVFRQAGKKVEIKHDVNIAVVAGMMEDKIRCGLILRGAARTTTFNFQIEQTKFERKGENVTQRTSPHIGFDLAADFLESIQLAVTAGFTEGQIETNGLSPASPAATRSKMALKRIGRLNQSIRSIENMYDIRYRPERPDFQALLDEAKS